MINLKYNKELMKKENLYIIGVSGGSDSMALLDLLYNQDYRLVVTHVNYHYRHDSNVDQKIVEDYCNKRNILFFVKEISKGDYNKDNFQMQARDMRYDFYQEIADKYNCNEVVLAHHQDDVLENIYMQIERKNLKSYLGIKEVSYVKGLKIIRPLLELNKKQIIEYCKSNNVDYHDDYTNFQTEFKRDYVRNKILVDYSEDEKQALLIKAKKHNQLIDEEIGKMKGYYQKYDKDKKINYLSLSEIQLENIVYYMIKDVVYPPLISDQLIKEVIKQIHSDKPNLKISLPVNALFIKEYDNIYTLIKESDQSYCLKYNRLVYDKQDYFYLSDKGHLNEGICLLEEDFPIMIRNYRSGDVIITAGGTKKVSRLFIDNKIPKSERVVWPIVVRCDGTIILIPNIAKNIKYLYSKPNVFVLKYSNLRSGNDA